VGVGRDITEIMDVQQERERLLKTLEIKNKELESVVYIASHDLQAPLVNLRGFSGELTRACDKLCDYFTSNHLVKVIEDTAPVQDDIRESLHFINASAVKMHSLVDGLLRISRIGTAEIDIKSLDMNDMIKHIVSAMQFQIQQSAAQVTVEDLPACMGDSNLVNQVFSNLMDNALKYLAPKRPGEIHVSGSRDRSMVCYHISDNGIGIPVEYQSKIFDVFHRLDPNASVKGEGLGLSIVVRVMDRLGGTVDLESTPGKGTTFHLHLPACPSR
jgi:signal transduction histidine kinase